MGVTVSAELLMEVVVSQFFAQGAAVKAKQFSSTRLVALGVFQDGFK